jgi:hypothetical protein
MRTETKERKTLYNLVRQLPKEDVEKVTSYAAFLWSLQEKEDMEDLRAISERIDEPTIPWETLKKEHGL